MFEHKYILNLVIKALIINIMVYGILVYYANNISIKLFDLIFLKKDIKINAYVKRYSKLLLVCSIIIFISSILETYLTPFLIKLFSFLIK